MPGTSPSEAQNNFVERLQQTISCVSNAVFTYTHPENPSDSYSLFLANNKKVKLDSPEGLMLSVAMRYTFVQVEGERGPWKVTAQGYIYSLDSNGQELIAYHYHPDAPNTIACEHLHIGAAAHLSHQKLRKGHMPTGRVALEDVILFAIRDLKVKPCKRNWEKIIRENRARFRKWKTWG